MLLLLLHRRRGVAAARLLARREHLLHFDLCHILVVVVLLLLCRRRAVQLCYRHGLWPGLLLLLLPAGLRGQRACAVLQLVQVAGCLLQRRVGGHGGPHGSCSGGGGGQLLRAALRLQVRLLASLGSRG